jgi:hypothetical protein
MLIAFTIAMLLLILGDARGYVRGDRERMTPLRLELPPGRRR